jgi:hypothetical protein
MATFPAQLDLDNLKMPQWSFGSYSFAGRTGGLSSLRIDSICCHVLVFPFSDFTWQSSRFWL